MRFGHVLPLLLCVSSAFAADQKLIALTFDDGPRPYVLYGNPPAHPLGLLTLLDRNDAKATFFVMGWRLQPKVYGDRREIRTATTCLEAAQDVFHREHEIENHTFSHIQLRLLEHKKGDAVVLSDVEKGATMVRQVTGSQPHYVRPPNWVMWDDMRHRIEARGFHVLTISSSEPAPMRDVNSADYLCAGNARQCPKPSLSDFVIQEIAQREKRGVYTHILAFHELSTTVTALELLLPQLKARGYRFVTLEQYAKQVGNTHLVTKTGKRASGGM